MGRIKGMGSRRATFRVDEEGSEGTFKVAGTTEAGMVVSSAVNVVDGGSVLEAGGAGAWR
jgi:hypothetical protein